MALYLGSQKVTITTLRGGSSGGINYASGTVTCDENGVITFPKFDFTPTMITVWNVVLRDLAEEEGLSPEEWPDDMVRFIHEGVMLMAINIDGRWVSQGVTDNSAGMYISNNSAEGGTKEFFPESSSSGITVDGDIYTYQLGRYTDEGLEFVVNMEFNYAIYG